MPRTRWPHLALGLALAGMTGVSLWISGSLGDRGAPSGAAASSGASTATDDARGPLKPSPLPGTSRSAALGAAPAPVAAAAPERPVAPAPLPRSSLLPPGAAAPALTEAAVWAHYQPTPEELAYRAYKVEQEANAELRNLLRVLDLEEAQQNRVFAALARSSSYYHPSLQPQGADGAPLATGRPSAAASETSTVPAAPGEDAAAAAPSPSLSPATATDPVLAELTPEQADVYERYTSERDAFWAGIVEDIEKEINASP